MLKPLSKNTIEKKYAELGLSAEKIDTLHRYFSAFSNLYGFFTVSEAWELFKHYEGIVYLHKKDFVAFSEVAQREDGLSYYVIDINEIFLKEEPGPLQRLIVNKELVGRGYTKYLKIYHLGSERDQYDISFFIPEKKDLPFYESDPFYKTEAGKKMASFIRSLKSSGIGKLPNGKEWEITDIAGEPVKEKRLDSFVAFSTNEKFEIGYYKKETEKKRLEEKYSIPPSEKILKEIKSHITEGSWFCPSPAFYINLIMECLVNDYGVGLSAKQAAQFMSMYTDLNNTSHLWCRCGWTPIDLHRTLPSDSPPALSIGPNMKKMIQNGELDLENLKEGCEKLGIKLLY